MIPALKRCLLGWGPGCLLSCHFPRSGGPFHEFAQLLQSVGTVDPGLGRLPELDLLHWPLPCSSSKPASLCGTGSGRGERPGPAGTDTLTASRGHPMRGGVQELAPTRPSATAPARISTRENPVRTIFRTVAVWAAHSQFGGSHPGPTACDVTPRSSASSMRSTTPSATGIHASHILWEGDWSAVPRVPSRTANRPHVYTRAKTMSHLSCR